MRRRGRGRGSVSSLFLKTVLFVDVAFAAFYQRHFEAKNHLKEEVLNVVFFYFGTLVSSQPISDILVFKDTPV